MAAKKTEKPMPVASLRSGYLYACYAFAVDPEDIPSVLNSQANADILGMRYLLDKIEECSFMMLFPKNDNNGYEVKDELNVDVDNLGCNATSADWWAPPRKILEDTEDRSMRKRFEAECPNFNKPLEKGAPLYMLVKAPFFFRYDFPAKGGKVTTGSVSVFEDWKKYDGVKFSQTNSINCWRYAMMYGPQLVTATSIFGTTDGKTPSEEFCISVTFATTFAGLDPFPTQSNGFYHRSNYYRAIFPAEESIGDALLEVKRCTVPSLPFFDKLLSLNETDE